MAVISTNPIMSGFGAPLPTQGQTSSSLDSSANEYVRRLLGGQLGQGTQGAIQRASATQAVAGGMPGTGMLGGSLFGNRTLRDIGRTAEQQQQQGFQNFLGLGGLDVQRQAQGTAAASQRAQEAIGRGQLANQAQQLRLEGRRLYDTGEPVYNPSLFARPRQWNHQY